MWNVNSNEPNINLINQVVAISEFDLLTSKTKCDLIVGTTHCHNSCYVENLIGNNLYCIDAILFWLYLLKPMNVYCLSNAHYFVFDPLLCYIFCCQNGGGQYLNMTYTWADSDIIIFMKTRRCDSQADLPAPVRRDTFKFETIWQGQFVNSHQFNPAESRKKL